MEITSLNEKTNRADTYLRDWHSVSSLDIIIKSDSEFIGASACGASLGAMIFRIKFGSNNDYTFYSLRNTYMSYVLPPHHHSFPRIFLQQV